MPRRTWLKPTMFWDWVSRGHLGNSLMFAQQTEMVCEPMRAISEVFLQWHLFSAPLWAGTCKNQQNWVFITDEKALLSPGSQGRGNLGCSIFISTLGWVTLLPFVRQRQRAKRGDVIHPRSQPVNERAEIWIEEPSPRVWALSNAFTTFRETYSLLLLFH